MLTFWIRPAAAALLWVIFAGTTLSELGTLPRALRSAAGRVQPHAICAVARAGGRPVQRGRTVARDAR